MFQMLAYLCMEVPGSFEPDAIRNEKAKLLQSVRHVHARGGRGRHVVRGPVRSVGSTSRATARRRTSTPDSKTETYAAARLYIDNWRWEGVPIYLRSGKALWKRGTEIVVEFKKAPEVDLPRHAGDQPRREPADLPHPAVPGHRDPVPGQDPRAADAAPAGPHEVRLRRRVQGVALHRLRGDALLVLARRRHAVLARRSRRGRVAHRAADPRQLEGDAGGIPELHRAAPGAPRPPPR